MDDDITAKEKIHGAIEPLVQGAFVYAEGEALTASIAISLRRIADALETGKIGDSVYNAISTAIFEDFQRRA